jgi:hypothetical protein
MCTCFALLCFLITVVPEKIAKAYHQSLAAKAAGTDFVFLII